MAKGKYSGEVNKEVMAMNVFVKGLANDDIAINLMQQNQEGLTFEKAVAIAIERSLAIEARKTVNETGNISLQDELFVVKEDQVKAEASINKKMRSMEAELDHVRSELLKAQRGGGKGIVCFNCSKVGHYRSECTQEAGNIRGGNGMGSRGGMGARGGNGGLAVVCYACGEKGHYASACPGKGVGRGREGNDRMGGTGRGGIGGGMGSGTGQGVRCYNCNEQGHIQAQCTQPQGRTCYFCQEKDHLIKDCPKRNRDGNVGRQNQNF